MAKSTARSASTAQNPGDSRHAEGRHPSQTRPKESLYSRLSLRTYLFLILALVGLVPIGLLGIVQARGWAANEAENAERSARTTVRSVAAQISLLSRFGIQSVDALAAQVEAANADTPGKLEPILVAHQSRHPEFFGWYVADKHGRSILNVTEKGVLSSGNAYGDRLYFQEVERTGETAVSNVRVGRLSGAPNLQVAAPIIRNGAFDGIAEGSIHLSHLTNPAREVAAALKSGRVLVLDPQDRLLFDSAEPERQELLPYEDLLNVPRPSSSLSEQRFQGVDEHGMGVQGILKSVAPDTLNWRVLILQGRAGLARRAQIAQLETLVLGGAAMLMALLLAGIAARFLALPVAELAQRAAQVEGGSNLDTTPRLERAPSEIVQLEAAFLKMLTRLRRHASHLEETVEERTSQLSAAEHALRRSERMAAVGTLAASVAHEINNPLTYLLSNLDYAQSVLSSGETSITQDVVNEALSEAQEGAQRIDSIVTDLRGFARQDRESLQGLNLKEVIDSSLKMTAAELHYRCKLECEVPDELCVFGNFPKLSQVFVNLLLNAAQALPEGDRANQRIRVRAFGHEESVRVEVEDTGRGMSPDELDQAFEPFFTTKGAKEGTGLGLSICTTIIQGVGGRLTGRSELGKGSTFTVELPCWEPSYARRNRPPLPPKTKPMPKSELARVLVIDDDLNVGRGIRRMLREHHVEVVSSAKDGLRKLRSASFDVILCDLMMPDMTGMQLHQTLTQTQPGLLAQLVFMTGGAFTEGALHFLDRKDVRVIAKPFGPEILRQCIRDTIHLSPSNTLNASSSPSRA